MESLHIKRSSERKKIEQIIVCLQELYNSSLVVVTTAQLHSTKPELSSAQIQILLATCQRFVMVRILDNFFFFNLEFTPCKSDKPLPGMELREIEEEKRLKANKIKNV